MVALFAAYMAGAVAGRAIFHYVMMRGHNITEPASTPAQWGGELLAAAYGGPMLLTTPWSAIAILTTVFGALWLRRRAPFWSVLFMFVGTSTAAYLTSLAWSVQ